MIREAIAAIVDGRSLSQEEAAGAMRDVMAGEATPAQVGAFVTALRMKGETPEEIAGMARVMREKALKVDVAGPLVDPCGTGGDGAGTFNISTAAAFVVAAAGLKVAKHGNRAASGVCGSADILEALGVKIALGPQGVRKCLEQVGIGFMFAPVFHPAMKHAAGPRREIGSRGPAAGYRPGWIDCYGWEGHRDRRVASRRRQGVPGRVGRGSCPQTVRRDGLAGRTGRAPACPGWYAAP